MEGLTYLDHGPCYYDSKQIHEDQGLDKTLTCYNGTLNYDSHLGYNPVLTAFYHYQ